MSLIGSITHHPASNGAFQRRVVDREARVGPTYASAGELVLAVNVLAMVVRRCVVRAWA